MIVDLSQYGYHYDELQSLDENIIPARITQEQRGMYEAICAHGEVQAHLKGTFVKEAEMTLQYPTVGDFVLIQYNAQGSCPITELLPRRTKFSRVQAFHKSPEQLVAANFDYVCILSSLNQDFNISRIERYMAAAWQSGALPLVVLTKADLCEDPAHYVSLVQQRAVGVDVFAISAVTGEGVEALRTIIKPAQTVVFLGMSGVGKSSLVNALAGEVLMYVNDIREDDARGRHTTTYRQLLRLPSGVLVIDTPGMRELGLWDVDEGLQEAFPDIEEIVKNCRFSDCTHKAEPGCALLAALKSGQTTPERVRSYEKLLREARFSQRKANRKIRESVKVRSDVKDAKRAPIQETSYE